MFTNMGKALFVAGLVIAAVGLFFWFSNSLTGKIPFIDKLGRLPGDFKIEKNNFTFIFPLTTCIIISIVLTLILKYFFKQ